MAPLVDECEIKGDFTDQQFSENEVADKVVEQCKCLWFWLTLYPMKCSV